MTATGREPLLAALKLAAVEGPLCDQDRNNHFGFLGTAPLGACPWRDAPRVRTAREIRHW
jgi:hypothetical protein